MSYQVQKTLTDNGDITAAFRSFEQFSLMGALVPSLLRESTNSLGYFDFEYAPTVVDMYIHNNQYIKLTSEVFLL